MQQTISSPELSLTLRRYPSFEQDLYLSLSDSKAYDALLEDIKSLNGMYIDLQSIVEQQQPSIDLVENNLEHSKILVIQAEKELEVGKAYQTTTIGLKIAAIIVAGTTLGAGFGGAALFLGIKPILGVVFGGGFGVVLAGIGV